MEIKCEHPNIIINPSLKMVLLSSMYYVIDGKKTVTIKKNAFGEYDEDGEVVEKHDFAAGCVWIDTRVRRNITRQANYISKHFGRAVRDALHISADKLENSYCMTFKGERVPIWLLVPCGKCELCRDKAIKEWKTRCWCESHPYGDSNKVSKPLFVTLTYCDADSPFNILFKRPQKEVKYLCKRHLQLFFKRLRKYLSAYYPDCKIRYYVCGEYGSNYHRPHYHLLIWGLPRMIDQYVGDIVSYIKDIQIRRDIPCSPDSLEKYHCGQYEYFDDGTVDCYATRLGIPIDTQVLDEFKDYGDFAKWNFLSSVDVCKYIFNDRFCTADGKTRFPVRSATKQLLQDCWSYGYVDLQDCKDMSGQYCMKYIKKSDTWLPVDCPEESKPFYLSSRGKTFLGNSGGLGIDWLEHNKNRYLQDLELNTIVGTAEVFNPTTREWITKPCNMGLPKYFNDKLFPTDSRVYTREFREVLKLFVDLANSLLYSSKRKDVKTVIRKINDTYPLNIPIPTVLEYDPSYNFKWHLEKDFQTLLEYADFLIDYYTVYPDGSLSLENDCIRSVVTCSTAKKRKLQAFARTRSQNCDCSGLAYNKAVREEIRMKEPKGLIDPEKVYKDSLNIQNIVEDPEISLSILSDISHKICNYIQTFDYLHYERKPLPDFKRPYPSADTKCSQFFTL